MPVQDLFAGDYNIETPERVSLEFEIADLGNRFLAALIDTALVTFAIVGLNGVIFFVLDRLAPPVASGDLFDGSIGWAGGFVVALYALLNFFIFWGYYILQEAWWSGQTIGKRRMRIRVVRVDGGPAGATEIMTRNLVRVIDLLPAAYLIGFISIVANRQARRLGDIAAGTLVVKAGGRITLDSLLETYGSASEPASPAPASSTPIDEQTTTAVLDTSRLRPADYTLIDETLKRAATGNLDPALLARLAAAIATKMGYAFSPGEEARSFLDQVAAAYRKEE